MRKLGGVLTRINWKNTLANAVYTCGSPIFYWASFDESVADHDSGNVFSSVLYVVFYFYLFRPCLRWPREF